MKGFEYNDDNMCLDAMFMKKQTSIFNSRQSLNFEQQETQASPSAAKQLKPQNSLLMRQISDLFANKNDYKHVKNLSKISIVAPLGQPIEEEKLPEPKQVEAETFEVP